MPDGRLLPIVGRALSGALPVNIALMQLMVEARAPGDIDDVLADAPGNPDDASRLRTLADLWRAHPGAFATVKAVLAEADHAAGAARGPEHWAAVFDRLALVAPDAGVALYGFGAPDVTAAATAEVVDLMRAWGLLGPDRRLLEIGCGVGRLTLALVPHVRDAVGLDVSGAMVAEARRRAAGAPNATFARTDGRDLADIPAASADTVLAADVFPYLVEAGEGIARRHLADAARVLGPGGALLILNYSYRGDPAVDAAEIRTAFAENGLSLERDAVRPFALWDALAWLGRKSAA